MQKDGYQTCILNKFTRRVVVETRVLLVTNTIRRIKNQNQAVRRLDINCLSSIFFHYEIVYSRFVIFM